MPPDNKFCPKCSYYDTNNFEFYEKYGESACSGIPSSSGEFPYDQYPHCFTDKKLPTIEEKKEKLIKEIKQIILTNDIDSATKIIASKFKKR